jgi:hypothetical protein
MVASGLEEAWENVAISFERFCLTAGIATLSEMMEQDAVDLCGARHGRDVDRGGYRWGRTRRQAGLPRRQGGDRAAARARPQRCRGRVGRREFATAIDWRNY